MRGENPKEGVGRGSVSDCSRGKGDTQPISYRLGGRDVENRNRKEGNLGGWRRGKRRESPCITGLGIKGFSKPSARGRDEQGH